MFEVTESVLSARTAGWVDYPPLRVPVPEAEEMCRRDTPRLLEATTDTLTFGWDRFTAGHPVRKARLHGSAGDIAALRHTLGL